VSTILIIPPLSDRYFGRRPIILIANSVVILALIGLLVTTNLYEAYVYMFILGACGPGRSFVSLTNCLEFQSEQYKYIITFCYLCTEPTVLTLITLWYQFIDKGWFGLQLMFLLILVTTTLCYLFFVPQSPKWLFTVRRFAEAKEVVQRVADFNGVDRKLEYRFKDKNRAVVEELASANASAISYQMTDSTYYKNLAINALMWTAASFSFYTIQYMTKYFEGNLFVNYYLDAAATFLGLGIALPVYKCMKIRFSFIFSLSMTTLLILLLFLF
jgi:hypothetical protein